MAARRAEKRVVWDTGRVERVRRICMDYPEVTETEQFGEPWWKAGKKAFVSYGAEADDGTPRDGMAFNLTVVEQSQLLTDPRFSKTRHIGQHGWTTLTFGTTVDWSEVEELIDAAYRKVALRRMLQKVDHAANEAELAMAAVRTL